MADNAARRARRNYAAEYAARKAKAQAQGYPGVAAERRSRTQTFARRVLQRLFPRSGVRQTTVKGKRRDWRAIVRAVTTARPNAAAFGVRLFLADGRVIQGRTYDNPKDAYESALAIYRKNYSGDFGAIVDIDLTAYGAIAA